ncbi:HtaA domain-containing protein [Streptomyces rhizosphaericus]|uniref:Htaa domain-containing protein n=1 Tax=Streptomyces rhizosphaericus TaxID=114699 RepID=A0A6G4AWP3_9ACTN|nr:HtaA domain-containing protein [Streptomyces rhizosphaericus]NEW77668.1 hypothetical protein [Streptomyces rhizosphaericus]
MTVPPTTSAPRPRRPAARGALALATAVAAVAALGAAGTVLPAHAAAAPGLELKDGTLEWGVKEGFRKYVTGPIAHGTIEVADGARQAPDNGPFTFTDGTGTYDTSTHAVDTTFKGKVRFTGHAGALDLTLADLKVRTAGTSGEITADVTSSGTTSDDVSLVTLDLSGVTPGTGEGGRMTFADIPTKLTAEGAKAFNDMYQEGQQLDPATLAVTPGTATPPTPTATPTPTRSPSATPTPTTPTPTRTTAGPPAGPTDAPTESSGTAPGVVDGNLDWGVKKSFRDYVTGPIAKGKITLSGGAAEHGDGYRFPHGEGAYDAGGGSLDAAFDGAVRFTGHEGSLDLKFSDLNVEVKGAKGALVADVSSKDRETGKVTESDDVTVADLATGSGLPEPEDGVITLTDVPAALTADGAKAFGGFYAAGDALDPVTVAVSLDEDADLPGGSGGSTGGSTGGGGDTGGADGTDTGGSTTGGGAVTGGSTTGGTGSLATTGADLPTGALLGGAGAMAVVGTAAVLAAARRRADAPAPGGS